MSVPVYSGGWWYVTSTVEGSSYPIHHRGPTAAEATAQILLDENVEAEGHDYFDVGAFDISHDHTHVGVVVRHRRRRALHAPRPRPGDRNRPGVDHIVDVCNAGSRLVARRARTCST